MSSRAAWRFMGLCLGALAEESLAPVVKARLAQGRVDWEEVARLSSRLGVGPALFSCLARHGLEPFLDRQAWAWLRYAHALNLGRNRDLLNQAGRVCRALNAHGVRPVFIKGLAHLACGLYPDQGARVMGDIDLLVPGDRVPDCVAALKAQGYALGLPQRGEGMVGRHFPKLVHPGHAAAVEVHRWAVPANTLSASRVLEQARPLDLGGAQAGRPSLAHSMMINIIHAQKTGAEGFAGRPEPRALLDHALLARRAGQPDWLVVEAGLREAGLGLELDAFVETARWLMGLKPAFRPRRGLALALALTAGRLWASGRPFELAIRVGARLGPAWGRFRIGGPVPPGPGLGRLAGRLAGMARQVYR